MNLSISFRPKLLDAVKGYTGGTFGQDLVAGITVGIVALPLAMAFAIASGVKPEAGLFTAVIGGFIISALGGTRVSIGGPTGAFIVILYGIYEKYGAENLAICTMMAGVILFAMGAARLGTIIKYIPYPVNMGEWHNFSRLPKWPRSDALVFLTAFGLTVVVDLPVAVEIGMVLAAVLFIKRVSETTQITAVDESTETEGSQHSLVGREIPQGVMVYRIFGSFFFGAADKLESALKRLKEEPEVLILRMRKVLAIDATGLNALEDLYEKLRRRGKHLVLSGPHTQPLFMMAKAGFLDRLGPENICANIELALARSREILGLPAAPPADPLHAEKQKIEAARQDLAGAIERAGKILHSSRDTLQK